MVLSVLNVKATCVNQSCKCMLSNSIQSTCVNFVISFFFCIDWFMMRPKSRDKINTIFRFYGTKLWNICWNFFVR